MRIKFVSALGKLMHVSATEAHIQYISRVDSVETGDYVWIAQGKRRRLRSLGPIEEDVGLMVTQELVRAM